MYVREIKKNWNFGKRKSFQGIRISLAQKIFSLKIKENEK